MPVTPLHWRENYYHTQTTQEHAIRLARGQAGRNGAKSPAEEWQALGIPRARTRGGRIGVSPGGHTGREKGEARRGEEERRRGKEEKRRRASPETCTRRRGMSIRSTSSPEPSATTRNSRDVLQLRNPPNPSDSGGVRILALRGSLAGIRLCCLVSRFFASAISEGAGVGRSGPSS